jgi:hypothetical protein
MARSHLKPDMPSRHLKIAAKRNRRTLKWQTTRKRNGTSDAHSTDRH